MRTCDSQPQAYALIPAGDIATIYRQPRPLVRHSSLIPQALGVKKQCQAEAHETAPVLDRIALSAHLTNFPAAMLALLRQLQQ